MAQIGIAIIGSGIFVKEEHLVRFHLCAFSALEVSYDQHYL